MQTYEINLWLDKKIIEKIVKQFENDEQVMEYIKDNFSDDEGIIEDQTEKSDEIIFNGKSKNNLDHETFVLTKDFREPFYNGDNVKFNFCKTLIFKILFVEFELSVKSFVELLPSNDKFHLSAPAS